MSQTEQNQNSEDGCALQSSRENVSGRKNGKRIRGNEQESCPKKAKNSEHSLAHQNGGCQSDLTSPTTSSGTVQTFYGTGENNQEVIVKLFDADDPTLLQSNPGILKNIDKEGDIDDMCTFSISSPNNNLHLTSPTKSGDINEILASFNENIPLSCSDTEGLVSTSFSSASSTSCASLQSLTLPSSKNIVSTNRGHVLLTTANVANTTTSRSLARSSIPLSRLSSEDLVHLDELSKGTDISRNAELLSAERSIVDNDNNLDFRIIDTDRSQTLMTPEEMECQGLEFETRVPIDGDSIDEHGDESVDESQVAGGRDKSELRDSSISLASDQGTTQFIVNTEDGKQQVLNLKMSDVYQVVHLIGNPGTQNMTLPPGFAIQDGFLVLPVTTCTGGSVEDSTDDGASATESSFSHSFTVQQISQRNGKRIDMPSTSSGKLYCCMEENCGRLFDKQSKLRVHIMSHTGVRPFKCEVEGCQWAFRTNFQLKRHRLSHEKRKDYKCDEPDCGRLFSTIYNLMAHKKLHQRPLLFNCTVCDEKFDTQRKLDVHHKSHDNAQKQYKCPFPGCDRVFFSANCMGSHARWHGQATDLTCHYEGCGRVFTKLCRLKTHLRMHTGDKPFVCKICTAAFTTNSKLVRHEGIHTGLRPYACPVEGCGKRFPRQEHLTGHLNTHTGEKPFACPHEGCDAKFSAKSSMHVHYKKHKNGTMGRKMKFRCPLEGCKKIYTSKASLRGHLMKHVSTNFPNGVGEQNQLEIVAMLAASADFSNTSTGNMTQEASEATQSATTSLVTSEGSYINPADYLMKDEQPHVETSSFQPDVITHHVGNNVVTQLVVTDLTQALVSSQPSDVPTFSVASDVASTSSVSTVTAEQEEGSARTDYSSNQIWSVRAKNRRQLLKQRLSVGFNFDEKVTDVDKHKDTVMSGPTLNPHELLTSRAITFRDPETGTTYLQTQLMQDDPPNPEIYTDDELPALGNVTLPVEENSPLREATNVVDFTGTTINLQDLA